MEDQFMEYTTITLNADGMWVDFVTEPDYIQIIKENYTI